MTRRALTILVTGLLTATTSLAAPDPEANAEARRVVAETCSALSTPAAPEEVALKNELASTLWASRVGIKVASAPDVQAIGQMLRDLAATHYDWARLDARAQVAEFAKWAVTYKVSDGLADSIVKLSQARGTPVLSDVLILPCAVGAGQQPGLSSEQSALFDFWNNAAKKQCATQQTAWERSRDAYAKVIGPKRAPTTAAEYDAFVQVWIDRSALAECKGDYWLHFLITPKLIRDQKRPQGCK